MSTGRLIPISDAARLLQEFMPEKDARMWLASDSQHEPVIPCILRGGEPYYDMADLAHFVHRFLNPVAKLNEPDRLAYTASQPVATERRSGVERRVNPPLTLAAGIERRDYARGDRRGNGAPGQGLRTVH
jgi:hypothetical protein